MLYAHKASSFLLYGRTIIVSYMQSFIPRKNLTSSETSILNGVISQLATKGYAKTTIGELSALLGISKGLVHYHFSSKEILLQETIAYIYADARRFMEQQVWQTNDSWEQIRTFINVSCEYYADHGESIKALQEIRANFKPRQTISLAEAFGDRELEDLKSVLVAGQESGIFRHFDTAFAALLLRMSLNGASQRILASLEPKQEAALCATELVAMFYRAWKSLPEATESK